LSGYIPAADGTPLAFVLMCNHHTVKSRDVRLAQDQIVNSLARLKL
jgi:D-alanyl-D-alanine carboxypeptidase/D-alanyl-D-alanine-endopeptidase (penicillin-binding protein 4)